MMIPIVILIAFFEKAKVELANTEHFLELAKVELAKAEIGQNKTRPLVTPVAVKSDTLCRATEPRGIALCAEKPATACSS